MKDLFIEFEAPQKTDWLTQVEKGINTKPEAKAFADNVFGNVFLGIEDKKETSPAINATSDGWLIAQNAKSNAEVLQALQGGASAISLEIDKDWAIADFEEIFENVYLNFITLRLNFKNANAQQFLDSLQHYCLSKSIKVAELQVIIPAENAQIKSEIPLTFEIIANQNLEIVKRLAETLRIAEKIGIEKTAIALPSDKNFYLNIAQTKALKILSAKVNEAYNGSQISAKILVDIDASLNESDPNLQAIVATHQALASAVGGADLIEIKNLTYSESDYSAEFAARITRNIQNILAQESFLNRVADASQGSYFMDDLCANLMQEVWNTFIKD